MKQSNLKQTQSFSQEENKIPNSKDQKEKLQSNSSKQDNSSENSSGKSLLRSNSIENLNLSAGKNRKSSEKSPSKKIQRHNLEGRSPSKKSHDYLLSKLKHEGDQDDEKEDANQKSSPSSPGLKKFTRDISDVAVKKLPQLPEQEIEENMLPEGLEEVARIKYLLNKKNIDQQTYFFTNIDSIFKVVRHEYHQIYGIDYNKTKTKEFIYNFETQPTFEYPVLSKYVREEEIETFSDLLEFDLNGSPVKEYQEIVQDKLLPIIFGSWLHQQTEYLQIVAGEAFIQILNQDKSSVKANPLFLKTKYLIALKNEAIIMLGQWSVDILEVWIEVYARSLAQLMRRGLNEQELNSSMMKKEDDLSGAEINNLREECKREVLRISDRNQSMKVRVKAAALIGQLAKHRSLGSDPLFFKTNFVQKIKTLCQDMHWDVRKETCKQLIHVSKYICSAEGTQFAQKEVLPEIKELFDDESEEIAIQAFIQYQKHIQGVFSLAFIHSEEAARILINFLNQVTTNHDHVQIIDLVIVLKKLPKILITLLEDPANSFANFSSLKLSPQKQKTGVQQITSAQKSEIYDQLILIIKSATENTQDDEIRMQVPQIFRLLGFLFRKREDIHLLTNLIQELFLEFIQREIKLGRPSQGQDGYQQVPSQIHGQTTDFFSQQKYNLFGDNEKLSEKEKRQKEQLDYQQVMAEKEDQNFQVNKSIVQNIHYLIGVILKAFIQQIQEIFTEQHSPHTNGYTQGQEQQNLEKLNNILFVLLKQYYQLLETTDIELMHHVLFGFGPIHKQMLDFQDQINTFIQNSNLKGQSQTNWVSDQIRQIYEQICETGIKVKAESIVKYTWRYHLTWIKCLEVLLIQPKKYDLSQNEQLPPKLPRDQKQKSTYLILKVCRSEIITKLFSIANPCPQRSDGQKQSNKKVKLNKNDPQQNTSLECSEQVREYIIRFLANQMTNENVPPSFRTKVSEFFQSLFIHKSLKSRLCCFKFLSILVKEQLISAANYQKHYFEAVLSVLEDQPINALHLFIVRELLPKQIPLIYDNNLLIEKLNLQIEFLKNRCENQGYISKINYKTNDNSRVAGNVIKILQEEIEEFQNIMSDKSLESNYQLYLDTIDKRIRLQEDRLEGRVGSQYSSQLSNRAPTQEKNIYKQKATDHQCSTKQLHLKLNQIDFRAKNPSSLQLQAQSNNQTIANQKDASRISSKQSSRAKRKGSVVNTLLNKDSNSIPRANGGSSLSVNSYKDNDQNKLPSSKQQSRKALPSNRPPSQQIQNKKNFEDPQIPKNLNKTGGINLNSDQSSSSSELFNNQQKSPLLQRDLEVNLQSRISLIDQKQESIFDSQKLNQNGSYYKTPNSYNKDQQLGFSDVVSKKQLIVPLQLGPIKAKEHFSYQEHILAKTSSQENLGKYSTFQTGEVNLQGKDQQIDSRFVMPNLEQRQQQTFAVQRITRNQIIQGSTIKQQTQLQPLTSYIGGAPLQGSSAYLKNQQSYQGSVNKSVILKFSDQKQDSEINNLNKNQSSTILDKSQVYNQQNYNQDFSGVNKGQQRSGTTPKTELNINNTFQNTLITGSPSKYDQANTAVVQGETPVTQKRFGSYGMRGLQNITNQVNQKAPLNQISSNTTINQLKPQALYQQHPNLLSPDKKQKNDSPFLKQDDSSNKRVSIGDKKEERKGDSFFQGTPAQINSIKKVNDIQKSNMSMLGILGASSLKKRH